MSINASMSFSNPLSSHHIFVSFSCHVWGFCYILYEHVDFIEGNEKFELGGEDLEKSQLFFKNFKILHSKNCYFPNLIHSTPP